VTMKIPKFEEKHFVRKQTQRLS